MSTAESHPDSPVKGSDPSELPAGADKGRDDSLLESLGKSIAAPVEGAAEPEEPPADPKKPPVAPG